MAMGIASRLSRLGAMDAIVAEDLRKRYKAVQALDGLSFSVREGEVFGLLGPNGAGKSTTVRVLTTLTRPDSGRAFVAGEDVVANPSRVRHSIGYIAQDSGVDWDATARENLLLQGRIHGMAGKPLHARVDELLELVGLRDAADRVARGYSGGMKRRLDVAIGLVHRPKVLFLDEPTTGLDPEARASMWIEVERLAQAESLTILLTTHYLEEADRLAERVAIVSRGRIVVEGTPEELKRNLQGESVSVELSEQNGRLADAERIVGGIGSDVNVDGQTLRARVPNGAQAIPVILGALDSAGIEVASVTTARPSLDDVYLHYTGRDFTSEDEAGS
jgi:ABC-2 type transport system ATP-binding protein